MQLFRLTKKGCKTIVKHRFGGTCSTSQHPVLGNFPTNTNSDVKQEVAASYETPDASNIIIVRT